MLVGSLATNFHGVPRSTRDADLVVQLQPQDLSRIANQLGPRFRSVPQASFETITGTVRHVIELVGSVFTVELFELTDDPHDQARFARREAVQVLDRDAFVASAEDTIVTKLRWARTGRRDKDFDDARNVVAVQEERLDWKYIEHWCEQHGTTALLARVRPAQG
jgi:hypothetical protein